MKAKSSPGLGVMPNEDSGYAGFWFGRQRCDSTGADSQGDNVGVK